LDVKIKFSVALCIWRPLFYVSRYAFHATYISPCLANCLHWSYDDPQRQCSPAITFIGVAVLETHLIKVQCSTKICHVTVRIHSAGAVPYGENVGQNKAED